MLITGENNREKLGDENNDKIREQKIVKNSENKQYGNNSNNIECDTIDQIISQSSEVHVSENDSWYFLESNEVLEEANTHSGLNATNDNEVKFNSERKYLDKTCCEQVELCRRVMKGGYPNAWGPKIPLKSKWNLVLLESLLTDYEDKEVVLWLKYGWPVSRPPNIHPPTPTYKNQASANMHPKFIEDYIEKELNRNAICGLFKEVPFSHRVRVSPLSTREKRDSQDRKSSNGSQLAGRRIS